MYTTKNQIRGGEVPLDIIKVPVPLSRAAVVGIAFAVFAIALLFAVYTNHAWEDWYITYRASKNLAMGNGLVFTIGERVHSFTSPLGTLIPSLLSVLTGNQDDQVLWLFRIIGCALLAASAVNLLRFGEATKLGVRATLIMLGLFAVDGKIIDFSINGMEVPYTIFFMSLALRAWTFPSRLFVAFSALAWAGLMWSRPDGFIYIAGLALGQFLFMPESAAYKSRAELLRQMLVAGAIGAAIYAPWIAWAAYYYGTPIPHTIVAKGLHAKNVLMERPLDAMLFPLWLLIGKAGLAHTFMPPYFAYGGWYQPLSYISHGVAVICAFYWVLPHARREGRAVSLVVFLGQFYLKDVSYGVRPWYVPPVTFLSIVVIGQIAQDVFNYIAIRLAHSPARDALMKSAVAIGALAVAGSFGMTAAFAYQARVQETVVERGHRQQIGLWLASQAKSPKDTVFVECLGYIGFYSNLKMYDYPGMSSPETVAARRKVGEDFAVLITEMKPDWLVLRPGEIDEVNRVRPDLLTSQYRVARTFDVSKEIEAYRFLPGRSYLSFDAIFTVYKRL